MENTELVKKLTDSFSHQLELYQKLEKLVNSILSQAILSRGNFQLPISQFEEKQRLIEQIAHERESIKEEIKQWMEIKSELKSGVEVKNLNSILDQITVSISHFLNSEEQLKKHLEYIAKKKEQSDDYDSQS